MFLDVALETFLCTQTTIMTQIAEFRQFHVLGANFIHWHGGYNANTASRVILHLGFSFIEEIHEITFSTRPRLQQYKNNLK